MDAAEGLQWVAIGGVVGTVATIVTNFFLARRKQELNHVSLEGVSQDNWSRLEFERLGARIMKLEVDNAACMLQNGELQRGLGEAMGKITGLTALITQIQSDHQKVVVEAVADKTAEVVVAKVEAAVEQAVGSVKSDRATPKASADAESRKPKPGNTGR